MYFIFSEELGNIEDKRVGGAMRAWLYCQTTDGSGRKDSRVRKEPFERPFTQINFGH